MLEKLQELGDHDVQRTIQHVTVQDLSGVLADLLQGSKRSLRDKMCINNRECEENTTQYHNSVILPYSEAGYTPKLLRY